METERRPPRARRYGENLAAAGRYDFSSKEAQAALGISAAAAKVALNRLAKHGAIASPARGFYVVVPPEYRSLGCLPADQFVPALMKRLNLSYYVGVLTAAQYHGAAHQRPQRFQVFLEKRRRPITCGNVRVAFMIRKRLPEVPVQSLNTPRGTLLVSTPEATAVGASSPSPSCGERAISAIARLGIPEVGGIIVGMPTGTCRLCHNRVRTERG
jgi:hypothetical protein